MEDGAVKFRIVSPVTGEEFEKYYDLRWRILRKPWGQPEGSEKDELENKSFHIMVLEGDRVIGVGRGHFNTSSQYQIRYMAVDENWRRKGVGTMILGRLQEYAAKGGAGQIVLKAREGAVKFYAKRGFKIVGQAHTLFGCIKHFKMIKELRCEDVVGAN